MSMLHAHASEECFNKEVQGPHEVGEHVSGCDVSAREWASTWMQRYGSHASGARSDISEVLPQMRSCDSCSNSSDCLHCSNRVKRYTSSDPNGTRSSTRLHPSQVQNLNALISTARLQTSLVEKPTVQDPACMAKQKFPAALTPTTASPSTASLASSVEPVPFGALPAGLPPSPDGPSVEAMSVTIDGCLFSVTRELGRGNFGVVFEATSSDIPAPVALKVSQVQNPVDSFKERTREALRLLTECTILKRLSVKLQRSSLPESEWHIPKYLAHVATSSKVTLAMTKAEGGALDDWLYGAVGSSTDLSKEGSMTFSRACDWVSGLLVQMAPVFSVLESVAFHRDISSHNFLVDDSGNRPVFAVVDLGLAVEAPRWRESWKTSNIDGSPRYWSPAHWTLLFSSADHLEKREPALMRLYRDRMDHYSFGVLVLELLFGLWAGPGEKGTCSPPNTLVQAWVAWHSYWSIAEMLETAFRENIRSSPALLDLDAKLCTDFTEAHAQLGVALRAAAVDEELCVSHGAGGARLLLAAAELLDPLSELSWDGVSDHLIGRMARFIHAAANE